MSHLFNLLNDNSIQYQRVDHPPVFTCEEARRLVPPLPGAETKNLFVRDGKGKRHFLVSVSPDKVVDLKELGAVLGVTGIGFASPERLANYLKLEPGAVTILSVINDTTGAVELIIDEELWQSEAFLCHPLVNTSTLSLLKPDLEKFLKLTDHVPRVVKVPTKSKLD